MLYTTIISTLLVHFMLFTCHVCSSGICYDDALWSYLIHVILSCYVYCTFHYLFAHFFCDLPCIHQVTFISNNVHRDRLFIIPIQFLKSKHTHEIKTYAGRYNCCSQICCRATLQAHIWLCQYTPYTM